MVMMMMMAKKRIQNEIIISVFIYVNRRMIIIIIMMLDRVFYFQFFFQDEYLRLIEGFSPFFLPKLVYSEMIKKKVSTLLFPKFKIFVSCLIIIIIIWINQKRFLMILKQIVQLLLFLVLKIYREKSS